MPKAPRPSRKKQFCAECDTFPSEDILEFLTINNGISQIRFCSVPDEQGTLPAESQLLKHNRPWAGGVRMFFIRGETNGYSTEQWCRLLDSLVMRPVELESNDKKYMWCSFAESLEPADVRQAELKQNVVRTNLKNVSCARHMSPRSSEAATRDENERLERATAEAVVACDEADRAAAEAATAGGLTVQAMEEIKRVSWAATRTYIERRFEQDGIEYFGGQPLGKGRKPRKHSLKSKKPKPQAAPPALPAAKTKNVPAPSMSIAQKAIQRAMPQPEGLQWKTAVSALLRSASVFAKDQRKSEGAVGVLRSVLPPECHRSGSSFFQTRQRTGLGYLFPTAERNSDPSWPSTLELHRCVLSLEGHAELLLRQCASALQPDNAAGLSPQDAADLQLAWMSRGGICGDGPSFWPEALDEGLFGLAGVAPSQGELLNVITSLRQGRAAAFRRDYLVVDEVTWCMPYLAKVFFLRAECHGVPTASIENELKQSFKRLTNFRLCAIKADRALLVAYGVLMLDYAGRLAAIAAALAVEDTDPTVLDRARATMQKAHEAGAQLDPEAVRCRKSEEARETRSILEDLGMRASPALATASSVVDAVRDAMAHDSHKRQATAFLHPSPSLPGAAYDPERYLESSAD